MGDYDNAERDLYQSLVEDPSNEDINFKFNRINNAREQLVLIHEYMNHGDHGTVVQLLTQMLELSPWCAEFREMRARSNLMIGDRISAVSDFKSAIRLQQDGSDDLTNRKLGNAYFDWRFYH